jgi:hypothetical protein
MTIWKSSALSTTPPMRAMAATDVETFLVPAGQVATAVTVTMTDLTTGAAAGAGVTASLTSPIASGALVTVGGEMAQLVRGHVYEIAAQFTDSGTGRVWTKVLAVDVPA